jgi:hypothetical protein
MDKVLIGESGFVKKTRRSRVVNPKSLKMLEGVVQGLSLAEAGRRAGYAHPQSSFRAYERLKLEIPGRFEALGGPVDKVLKKVISKLEAQESKIGWYKGEIIQVVNVENHDIQLRAADMYLDLCNAFPGRGNRQQGDDANTGTRGPTFTLVVADAGRAKAIMERVADVESRFTSSALGAKVDEDQGRVGPAEPLQTPPEL